MRFCLRYVASSRLVANARGGVPGTTGIVDPLSCSEPRAARFDPLPPSSPSNLPRFFECPNRQFPSTRVSTSSRLSLPTMSCNASSISRACRVQKGGSRRGPFSLLALSTKTFQTIHPQWHPCIRSVHLFRTIRIFKKQNQRPARAMGGKKSTSFFLRVFGRKFFSEQTPRIRLVGVVPAAQSTRKKDSSAQKQQLLDCL